jgi:anthranilate phosphoribosyltransferase
MIREALTTLAGGSLIEGDTAYHVMKSIMAGEATDAQIGAYLTALHLLGESPEVISGSARAMREACTPVLTEAEIVVDTCGTGGDGSHTINISTAAAFVAAGAGVTVAKHGNRSVTSQCGSADVLRALGVNVDVQAEAMSRCIDTIGIAFLFALTLHPAMKHAIGPRRELGFRTVFNILGPLSNPASAKYGVLGVYGVDLVETVARAAAEIGCRRLFVVHGLDGLDEVTTTAPTRIGEVHDGEVKVYDFDACDIGVARSSPADLKGGTPEENAAALRSVLDGAAGPHRDIVALNAAAAIVAGQAASDLKEGLAAAAAAIDSGAAREKLDALVQQTHATT